MRIVLLVAILIAMLSGYSQKPQSYYQITKAPSEYRKLNEYLYLAKRQDVSGYSLLLRSAKFNAINESPYSVVSGPIDKIHVDDNFIISRKSKTDGFDYFVFEMKQHNASINSGQPKVCLRVYSTLKAFDKFCRKQNVESLNWQEPSKSGELYHTKEEFKQPTSYIAQLPIASSYGEAAKKMKEIERGCLNQKISFDSVPEKFNYSDSLIFFNCSSVQSFVYTSHVTTNGISSKSDIYENICYPDGFYFYPNDSLNNPLEQLGKFVNGNAESYYWFCAFLFLKEQDKTYQKKKRVNTLRSFLYRSIANYNESRGFNRVYYEIIEMDYYMDKNYLDANQEFQKFLEAKKSELH